MPCPGSICKIYDVCNVRLGRGEPPCSSDAEVATPSAKEQVALEKDFDYAKNFLEISLSKVPYAEVEKVCGAGVYTTLFYLREFAKQKGKLLWAAQEKTK